MGADPLGLAHPRRTLAEVAVSDVLVFVALVAVLTLMLWPARR